MKMPSYRQLTVLFLIALSVVLGSVFAGAHAQPGASLPYVKNGEVSIDQAEVYWQSRIQDVGVAAARKEYIAVGKSVPASQAHEIAHGFGGALFLAKGLESIATCGDEFNYGCYHQFIGRAIGKSGLAVLSDLRPYCAALQVYARASCAHGIGHGIEGYVGYTPEDLQRTVAICEERLGTLRSSCVDGAIMEYNLRRMITGGADVNAVRPLTAENRYTPCQSLAKEYQSVCSFELPFWWLDATESMSPEKSTVLLSSYCSKAPIPRYCYSGVGYIAAYRVDFDQKRAAELCQLVSADADDQRNCGLGILERLVLRDDKITAELCEQFAFPAPYSSVCPDPSANPT